MSAVLNIGSKSDDWRARRLSNFSANFFFIDGQRMASVEGFIQGIKFPQGDPIRHQAFQAIGIQAKRFGKDAQHNFVWWKDKAIEYGSPEHRKLIERAIRSKFEQNKSAMDALVATDGMTLTHDLGYPDPPNSSLPAKVFCDILTRIRNEAIQTRK